VTRTISIVLLVFSTVGISLAAADGPFITGAEKRLAMTDEHWIVRTVPEMDDVRIYRSVYHFEQSPSGTNLEMSMDVYYPPHFDGSTALPAVILFSDNAEMIDYFQTVAWAELYAASGIAAITYQAKRTVSKDYEALLAYVVEHSKELHVNANRLALWAVSSLVQSAMNAVQQANENHPNHLSCAVFLYGRPASLRTNWDGTPVLLVFGGRDDYAKSTYKRRFESQAAEVGLTYEIIEYEDGDHAFDVFQDTEESIRCIQRIVDYTVSKLSF